MKLISQDTAMRGRNHDEAVGLRLAVEWVRTA